MFGFFGQWFGSDNRDVEKVIFDIAERSRKKDRQRLFDLMEGVDVCVPILKGSLPDEYLPGEKIVTDDTMNIQMTSTQIPNGDIYLMATTRDDHPALGEHFVTMKWTEFLNLVPRIPRISGIILEGKTSYAGFDEVTIENLKSKF